MENIDAPIDEMGTAKNAGPGRFLFPQNLIVLRLWPACDILISGLRAYSSVRFSGVLVL